tara:strand:- start:31 stop:570 length:540 start_codon:yes stop_codon:yes gene_type:complete
MGTIKTTNIEPIADNGTVTLGSSGDTFTVPSGVTVAGAMANTPAFRVYLNSNQTISQSTTTKINFDAEDYDTDNAFASNKFTPQVAGKYFFTSTIRLSSMSTTANWQIYLYKNGAIYSRFANDVGAQANPQISISDTIILNGSTDYVEIYTYQDNSNSSRDTFEGTNNIYFSGHRIIGA